MKHLLFALIGYLAALCLLQLYILVTHEPYVLPRSESALEIVRRRSEG